MVSGILDPMIVVTGATGFIGRQVVKELVKKKNPSEILCLVWKKNATQELRWRRWLKKSGVRLKKVELLDKASLVGLPKAPKLIFHLAATTDTALPDHRCNDVGTSNLIEALSPDKNTHFIHIGTSAMYCGRRDCRKPLNERSRPVPTNRYGRSKMLAEKVLVKDAGKRGYLLTILRPPTVYGANPRNDSLFDFVKKLVLKRSFLVRLNWPGLTSLVWVNDMAKAIIWAAKHPPKYGKENTFLVSTESITLAEICRLMHEKMGKRYQKICLPAWIWRLAAWSRRLIYASERLLPSRIYNLPWRASLVVDDVLYCDANKIAKFYPTWKPSLFKDKLDEVV